jgi:hypothetical protein
MSFTTNKLTNINFLLYNEREEWLKLTLRQRKSANNNFFINNLREERNRTNSQTTKSAKYNFEKLVFAPNLREFPARMKEQQIQHRVLRRNLRSYVGFPFVTIVRNFRISGPKIPSEIFYNIATAASRTFLRVFRIFGIFIRNLFITLGPDCKETRFLEMKLFGEWQLSSTSGQLHKSSPD